MNHMIFFQWWLIVVAFSGLLGIVIGLLAMRKGYSFWAWFFSGGFILLSAIALGFQPDARRHELSQDGREIERQHGNHVGLIVSIITIGIGLLNFFGGLISILR